MKQIIAIIIISLMLAGCGAKEKQKEPAQERPAKESRFMTVEGNTLSMWYVVVDRETGVMYAVSHGTYNLGTFTLLVDADGKPLIWEGVSNDQIER